MKASNKLLLAAIVIMSAFAAQSEKVWCCCPPSECQYDGYNQVRRHSVRDNVRMHIISPPHVHNVSDNSSLKCGQNALCQTLPGTFNWVYGQVGFYYSNTFLNRPVFVPMYVKEAALSDGEYITPYMIPKWDGRVLWMNINPAKSRIWIQPFYLDDDPSCTGCMKFTSRAILYKKSGMDYSAYPYGAALMYMYIKVDANFQETSYTIDVYDQDDKLPDSGKGLKLNIGDEVQAMYVEDDNDSPDWDYISFDDPDSTVVTQEPKFEYVGYIPGRDFITAYSDKVDLPQTDLIFRVAGYVYDAASNIEKPTYSESVALGKLRDNVCGTYPELTTKDPTLADVVGGLRILASLAPQHFCFRDVNADNKFDMAEVVWMLQKIAGLR